MDIRSAVRPLSICFLSVFGLTGAANATALIHIDLSSQTMHVESSSGSYNWAVSTARSGYYTPRGSFAPTGLQRMHFSKKYHMSPMPYSIFFRGGYAIHGTYARSALGRPASHGCVRLSPENAAALYHMVQEEGARISISGTPPGSSRFASLRHHHHSRFAARHVDDDGLAYAPRHRSHFRSVRGWQRNPYGYGYPSYMEDPGY